MADFNLLYSQTHTFLRTVLFENQYIFINVFSVLHFISGFILMYLILNIKFLKRFRKRPYLFLFILLISYEVFEILTRNIIFIPEVPKDIAWDLIFGVIGAFSYKKILKK